MKLGIISDTHNHIENTRRAVEIFRERDVERIIHCGDLTTTPIVDLFKGLKVTFVFGNMDHSHADLMTAAKKYFGIGSMGYHYTANIEGRRIAVCHGDDDELLSRFIFADIYDFVFHGHTHSRRDKLVGQTRVINPGAIGGKQTEPRSVSILDLETEEAEFVILEDEV